MVCLTNILLSLSAVSLSLAAPTSQTASTARPVSKDYTWAVTNWSAGCARVGCYHTFDISGPKTETYPKFTAQCSVDESLGYSFKQCKAKGQRNVKVASRFLERKDQSVGPKQFAVSIQYDGAEPSSYFNATGYHKTIYNQFVAPLQNFSVTPTEIWGVA